MPHRTNNHAIEVGPVSQGTFYVRDLLRTFTTLLSRYGACMPGDSHQPAAPYLWTTEAEQAASDPDHPWWRSLDAHCALEQAQVLLEDIAPPGYFFGTHPDDAACFGFWPEECDGGWSFVTRMAAALDDEDATLLDGVGDGLTHEERDLLIAVRTKLADIAELRQQLAD